MRTPETFAEWCDLFNEFKERINDEENLKAAYEGSFEFVPGAAELFSEKFLQAINERLKLAQSRFDRDMSHARGSEGEISRALSALKRELKIIYRFSVMPCTAGTESLSGCCDIVTDAAKTIESSLINSAKNDRSGKLSVMVKNAQISNITV